MEVLEFFLIGIALATDAFALTIANCTIYKNNLSKKQLIAMPVAFCLFQFSMPLLGYALASLISDKIASFSNYLTAGIFFILSIKIIYDIIKEHKEETIILGKVDKNKTDKKTAQFTFKVLIIQAIATSIDAFAIGLTFSSKLFLTALLGSTIIGVVTFLIVTLAIFFGKRLGNLLGKYAEWIGAIILFLLAVKSLITAII